MQIPANKHWFPTGFTFEANRKYTLSATGTWHDDNINCGPEGYTLQKEVAEDLWPFFRMVEPLRTIDTGDTWFQLLGRVGDSIFIIGKGIEFTSHSGGELFCTANDCPFMFWNNKGTVDLSIN